MSNYSKEEIKSFEQKDLRISKLAILKSLIEKCDVEAVNEVKPICDLTSEYINYVYGVSVSCVADGKETTIQWGQIAEGLNLAIPNAINIKMLNLLIDEYKKANKASANPSVVLNHVISRFGKYPTKSGGVLKVLESLKGD